MERGPWNDSVRLNTMRVVRQLRMSGRALAAHPVRTTLAVVTIAVGVAASVLTAAMSAGARAQMADRLDRVGSNLLVIRPSRIPPSVSRPAIRGAVTTLTPADVDAMAAAGGVAMVAPGTERIVRARSELAVAPASVLGTTAPFVAIRNVRLAAGRFVDAADDHDAARVAVLGARVHATLFADEPALGRSIRLSDVPFEVIGVLAAKGVTADGTDQDSQVFVPVRTAMRRLNNVTWLNAIFVRAASADAIPVAQRAIADVLAARHGRVDFEIQNTTAMLARQNETAAVFDRITLAVASITWALGGGGIVALMFLSASERTSEVGLRMAVGAMPRDVVWQFLGEAGAVAFTGWLAGVALGGLGMLVIQATTDLAVVAPVAVALWSLPLALVTGPLAGALPALRAASVPPMRALLSQ